MKKFVRTKNKLYNQFKKIGSVYNYLRVVWYNKFLLTGFILLVISFVFLDHHLLPINKYTQQTIGNISILFALGLLFLTKLGLTTAFKQRFTKRILRKDPQSKKLNFKHYCHKAGRDLALAEAKNSKPKVFIKWRDEIRNGIKVSVGDPLPPYPPPKNPKEPKTP